MTEILVNKTDLKDIRDIIDKLLKSGRENVTRHTQYASDETKELTERAKKILKYVKNNPGTIKENIIRERIIDNLDIGSRATVVKSIDELIEDRMLIVRPNDSNQHIQHLYSNHEHIVISLFNDLEIFKQAYFKLVDQTVNKVFKKLNNAGMVIRMDIFYGLLRTLLMPYKHLIMMYITSDLLLWGEQSLDKWTLYNKYAIIYDSMKEIHTKLHENISPLIISLFSDPSVDTPNAERELSRELFDVQDGLNRENIMSFLSYYEQFHLSAFAEAVLDVLWKISYPLLSKLDLSYTTKQESTEDWRNIISEYKPKSTQAQNLGKNNITSR
jgi:hypothetical protein